MVPISLKSSIETCELINICHKDQSETIQPRLVDSLFFNFSSLICLFLCVAVVCLFLLFVGFPAGNIAVGKCLMRSGPNPGKNTQGGGGTRVESGIGDVPRNRVPFSPL